MLLHVNPEHAQVTEIFAVCHAPRDIGERDFGDFYRPCVYLGLGPALKAALACMDENGGQAAFTLTGTRHRHVQRQWESPDHIVWLERLPVKESL